MALVGVNGAGKSTLIKILAGATRADAGEIRLGGEPAMISGPGEAHRLGLRFIHQELNVAPALSVAENIFLGRPYPRRLGAFVDWRALRARARAALAHVGVMHISPDATLGRLSVGDRMIVKIAAAFLDGGSAARLLVMDEPTAALTAPESARLFELIAALKARGCGVIYVSHRIDEVLRICDRITVLRDGVSLPPLATRDATRHILIERMTGRPESVFAPRPAPAAAAARLTVRNLRAEGVEDVSFDLGAGEILGLAGLAGSGAGRVLRALMGAASGGDVRLDGRFARAKNPAQAWALGYAYGPRERRAEGLVLSQDIARNVALPHLSRLARLGVWLARGRERALSAALAARTRLSAKGPAQKVRTLSGGNQQKVMIARALAGRPRALLLDEPTRGVDVGAKFDIHELMREIAAGGAGVLVASTDLEELLALCARIGVMREGRLAAIVPAAGLTPQSLLALCYGES